MGDYNTRLAMGMIAGASDLAFICPNDGRFAPIELKAPWSRHEVHKIKRQLWFGDNIIKHGGFFLITSDLEKAKNYITALIKHDFTKASTIQAECYDYMFNKVEKATTKTIKI